MLLACFPAFYSANRSSLVANSFHKLRLKDYDLFQPLKLQTYITLYAEVQLTQFNFHIKAYLVSFFYTIQFNFLDGSQITKNSYD